MSRNSSFSCFLAADILSHLPAPPANSLDRKTFKIKHARSLKKRYDLSVQASPIRQESGLEELKSKLSHLTRESRKTVVLTEVSPK